MRPKAIFIILLSLVVGMGLVATDNLQAADKVIKWRVQIPLAGGEQFL